MVKEINIKHQIDYADLPHFPLSTVESHHGKLIFGTINGQKCCSDAGKISLL
ncbi:MAG: hypothetical protein MZV64_01195 [Ignavibacteriales bacterium]|nr:hypothetical protein [Ignavibacteriales bacterium]